MDCETSKIQSPILNRVARAQPHPRLSLYAIMPFHPGMWNKDGEMDSEMARKEVTVFDILDKTATAKLGAEWGIEYFHPAKLDGKCVIMNVIWQTYPPEP